MDKLDKLKLASSSFSERLKTGGAQVGRIVSTKMKEILQGPTPESKIVDEATSETMEEANWGLNMRICAMINSEEFSGTEIVKAIKKKIASKSVVSQKLSLDLLEACTSNCEKVFSAVASEKLLEDMVRMIEDPLTDHGNREMASQLIRVWGESEDLMYLPAFRQTYVSLKTRGIPAAAQDGNYPPMQYTLESYVNQEPMSPPESYPIPGSDLLGADHANFQHGYVNKSVVEENKEYIVMTRNSVDLLSSILNSITEPKSVEDDLMRSMLEKCKESLPVVRRIAESTTEDEAMLFEALNLHDELQQVITRCEEMGAAAPDSGTELTKTTTSDETEPSAPLLVENHSKTETADSTKLGTDKSSSKTEAADSKKLETGKSSSEMKKRDSAKEESTESSHAKGNLDEGIRG